MPALGLASRQDDRLFPAALRTNAARAAEVRTANDHCITAHYPPAAPLPVLDPREDCVTQTY